jgi:hypothetical protein
VGARITQVNESLWSLLDAMETALAETIAAFALALDASTVSAIANDTFASSHQNLARGPRQSKI